MSPFGSWELTVFLETSTLVHFERDIVDMWTGCFFTAEGDMKHVLETVPEVFDRRSPMVTFLPLRILRILRGLEQMAGPLHASRRSSRSDVLTSGGGPQDLCGGRLQTFLWEHHKDSGERLVRVWTPPGWEAGQAVKALWLNDGQNLFRDEDHWVFVADAFGGACWGVAGTVAHLIAAKSIPSIVVLGIDHTGRMRTQDYLSAPPTGWDAPWGKGMRGDMWDAPGGGIMSRTLCRSDFGFHH
eukprot:s3957_g4.t1